MTLFPYDRQAMGRPFAPGSALFSTPTNDAGNDGLVMHPQEEMMTGGTRLARNRRTARLRRERKKQEAERLTQLRNDAVACQNDLKEKFEKIPEEKAKMFERVKEEDALRGESSGCLFCNRTFVINVEESIKQGEASEVGRHYLNEHPHEVKSNQGYLGEEFLLAANNPSVLLGKVLDLAQENIGKAAQANMAESTQSSLDLTGNQRKLSVEEKRRRRLERNAESARLCRQRKKLYIQRMRLELPGLLRENQLLATFINSQSETHSLKETRSESTKSVVSGNSVPMKETIPRMNGWDSSGLKKSKRNLSYGNLSAQCRPHNSTESTSSPLSQGTPSLPDLAALTSLMELNKTLNSLVLANALKSLAQSPLNNTNLQADILSLMNGMTPLSLDSNTSPTSGFSPALFANQEEKNSENVIPATPNKDSEVYEAACALTNLGR